MENDGPSSLSLEHWQAAAPILCHVFRESADGLPETDLQRRADVMGLTPDHQERREALMGYFCLCDDDLTPDEESVFTDADAALRVIKISATGVDRCMYVVIDARYGGVSFGCVADNKRIVLKGPSVRLEDTSREFQQPASTFSAQFQNLRPCEYFIMALLVAILNKAGFETLSLSADCVGPREERIRLDAMLKNSCEEFVERALEDYGSDSDDPATCEELDLACAEELEPPCAEPPFRGKRVFPGKAAPSSAKRQAPSAAEDPVMEGALADMCDTLRAGGATFEAVAGVASTWRRLAGITSLHPCPAKTYGRSGGNLKLEAALSDLVRMTAVVGFTSSEVYLQTTFFCGMHPGGAAQ